MLSLDHASRTLAGREVVHAIDLTLGAGEVLGLLGVNGAGKSTSLRMIAGVLAPSRGTVRVNGADLYENPALARRLIGYLPEVPPLHDESTVTEYLLFCARLRGLPAAAAQAAVDRALERCELGDVRRRLIGVLSKGFRQRVGVAQAIVHEPALIVLDEPASGLDPVQALKLRALIRRLGADHALVLSTHLLSDVLACCDRVAILHLGRLRHLAPLAAATVAGWRVGVAQALAAADWMALPPVHAVEAIDARHWRVTLASDADPSALAAAVVARGWALTELRAADAGLEETFLRIATADATEHAA